jgi:hypothetical protein
MGDEGYSTWTPSRNQHPAKKSVDFPADHERGGWADELVGPVGQERKELSHRGPDEYDKEMAADFRDVDPAELRLPPSRLSGADPYKLQRQIVRFGASTGGMPPVWVYEGSDGVLEIVDGATRATRIAKLAPGCKIRVEVVGRLRQPRGQNPRIGDKI